MKTKTVYEVEQVQGPRGPRYQVRVRSGAATQELTPHRLSGPRGVGSLQRAKEAIVRDANARPDPRSTIVDVSGDEIGIIEYGHLYWFPGALARYADASGQLRPNARTGEVVPSRVLVHRSGRTASPYGAVPWTGAPGDRESDWQVQDRGWTIRWSDGTVGIGRQPFETREQAEAWLDKERARLRAAEESRLRAFPPSSQTPKRSRKRAHQPNWRTMLDLPGVESRLGAQHVAYVLAQPFPAIYAKSRATGWWDANEPEYFEAYTSLARMIEDGELDDLIALARAR